MNAAMTENEPITRDMLAGGVRRGLGRRRFLLLGGSALAGAAVTVAGCGGGKKGSDGTVKTGQDGQAGGSPVANSGGTGAMYFPPSGRDDWEKVEPKAVGWDSAGLEDLASYAEERNSAGLVVLHRGRIMFERYWRGADLHTAGDIASAQKSVTSVLIGIAQEEGLLKIDDSVTKHLGEGWSNAPPAAEANITLRHLLTMTSGLNDTLAFEGDAGSTWYYNTPAYHLLKAAMEKASGKTIEAYSREKLLDRVGMADSSWQPRALMLAPLGARDAAAGVAAKPLTALVASTRDLSRFGLLALNDGAWNGVDIVRDRSYLAAATSTSQKLNPAYGYLWWLNGKESYVLPGRGVSGKGAMVPPAPADLFMALGAGDKKVYVAKSLGLVVARHGLAANVSRAEALSSFDGELWQRIMAAAPK